MREKWKTTTRSMRLNKMMRSPWLKKQLNCPNLWRVRLIISGAWMAMNSTGYSKLLHGQVVIPSWANMTGTTKDSIRWWRTRSRTMIQAQSRPHVTIEKSIWCDLTPRTVKLTWWGSSRMQKFIVTKGTLRWRSTQIGEGRIQSKSISKTKTLTLT